MLVQRHRHARALASSCRPSTGATRSRSRSRPAGRRLRWPSGCTTSWVSGSERSTSSSPSDCGKLRPGAAALPLVRRPQGRTSRSIVEESPRSDGVPRGRGPGRPWPDHRSRAGADSRLRGPRPRPAGRARLVAEARDDAIRIGARAAEQEEIDRLLVPRRRPERGPAEGRRPVRVRPRRRGGARAGAPPASRSRSSPASRRSGAVPAAAGIPVTHRGVSSQVTIANGQGELDFGELGRAGGTLICSWGSRGWPSSRTGSVQHGLDPQTPAAVISAGTREDGRWWARRCRRSRRRPPTCARRR